MTLDGSEKWEMAEGRMKILRDGSSALDERFHRGLEFSLTSLVFFSP